MPVPLIQPGFRQDERRAAQAIRRRSVGPLQRPPRLPLGVFAMSSFSVVILILGSILLVIAAVCAVIAWRGEGRLAAILNTPTSTTQEVYQRYRHDGGAFGQPCEVVGVVESDTSLTGPVSGQLCVIYSSTLTWEDWEQTSTLNRRGADMSGMVNTGG